MNYPDLKKPIKGQEFIDKLGELIPTRTTTGPNSDIEDGVEVIDVKAISKEGDK